MRQVRIRAWAKGHHARVRGTWFSRLCRCGRSPGSLRNGLLSPPPSFPTPHLIPCQAGNLCLFKLLLKSTFLRKPSRTFLPWVSPTLHSGFLTPGCSFVPGLFKIKALALSIKKISDHCRAFRKYREGQRRNQTNQSNHCLSSTWPKVPGSGGRWSSGKRLQEFVRVHRVYVWGRAQHTACP